MLSDFHDKNILLTGATGGIGHAICKVFSPNCARIYGIGRDVDKLQNLNCEFGNFFGIHGDLTSPGFFEESRSTLDARKIDILINCAGFLELRSISDIDMESIEKSFRTNVFPSIILTSICVDHMKKSGWGRIVNIGSSSSYNGGANTSLYCSSKHALLGFSKSMREELKEFGIKVISVSPASTQSKMGMIELNTPQKYDTFIDPETVAETVFFACRADGTADMHEIRIHRENVQ